MAARSKSGRTGIRDLSEEKNPFGTPPQACAISSFAGAQRRGDGRRVQRATRVASRLRPACQFGRARARAVRFDLDVFGLSLVEHNPGIDATGYGLLADFLRAVAK